MTDDNNSQPQAGVKEAVPESPFTPVNAADTTTATPEKTVREEAEEKAAKEEVKEKPPTRHPLEHRWTLWFDNKSKGGRSKDSWGATLNTVYSFGTVEEFWCLYNNIQTPGKLSPSADLHLFKEGIKPAWEDPTNEKGGSWTLSVPGKGTEGKNQLDKWWLDSLLALIGEQFTEAGEICGVSANVRTKNDRITLWTKTCQNEAAQISIGRQLRQITAYPDNLTLSYTFHEDSKASRSGQTYTV
eukprot:TRINITY_DN44282_c0_g1_i1.p1 TRINITY_DN44282_c0_g1~~TRINITY_DN44282_c0_g1_i1.p1  ORF type:complete len:243 (-),score=31.00 TRINITY_DN44282_c0_g1_i1:251-979(-)